MTEAKSETLRRPFQRVDTLSNAHVGRDFELVARNFFAGRGVLLQPNHQVQIGIAKTKKMHGFDLGCSTQKWLVECKSHRWTEGHNIPSAKLTVWNEAMYYFHVAPACYRKIMFVLLDRRRGNGESLAKYYLRTYGHLVPEGVEFWEYDPAATEALKIL